jgi:hypothetical protein
MVRLGFFRDESNAFHFMLSAGGGVGGLFLVLHLRDVESIRNVFCSGR